MTREENLTKEFDILKVVKDYIEVKNNKAVCPFHKEDTASLSINEDLGIFKCFGAGCGVGGNAIKFVSLIENITYTKALEKLAKRFNKPRLIKNIDKKDEYYTDIININKRLSYIYQKILFESPEAKDARDFLKKREISKETAKKLGIGYAPKNPFHLNKYDFDSTLLKKANILVTKNNKDVSFFKDRIIFPISKAEDIVGFMGRTLSDNPKVPKYLNSKEGDWFKKKEVIYGWDLNKSRIRKKAKVVVVEGQFDVAQLIEREINLGIAVSGSYFNSFQAYQISKSINQALIFCDGDKAGFKFGLNVGQMFLSHGVKTKIVFEMKKDPDDLLKEHGSFSKAIKKRTYNYLSFLYKFSKSSSKDNLKEAIKRLSTIQDKFTKTDQINQLSKLSNIPLEELYHLLNRFQVNPYTFNRPQETKEVTIEDKLLASLLVSKVEITEIKHDKFLISRSPKSFREKLINPFLISEDDNLINDDSFIQLVSNYSKYSKKDKEKLSFDLFNKYKIKLLNQLKDEIKIELKDQASSELIDKLNKVDNMITKLQDDE